MSDDIHFEQRGRLGVVTLDRPKALNALTGDMVRALSRQLCQWRDDPAIAMVVIKAVPGRAFCAGGDIAQVTATIRDHGVGPLLPFFEDEYRLNWRVKTFPKPYIALLDGITMGGGVGISVHGSHRIATERTRFAMPESAIGFFPDVGGSYFLPRLPHRLGRYLALTGQSIEGGSTKHAGLTTHMVSSAALAELESALQHSNSSVDAVLESFEIGAERAAFDNLIGETERLFSDKTLHEVFSKLERSATPFSESCLQSLRKCSPLSLRVAFAQLDRGAGLDIEGCMRMERRMVGRALAWPDFTEGVRALIIDKDKNPKWQYATVDDVPDHEVAAMFEPIDGQELAFHWEHT